MRLPLSAFLVCCVAGLARAQMPPQQVMVAPVELRPVELTQPLVASVMPVTRTLVAAEQEGIVEERMFDEGQRVEKGSLLARVNTDLLEKERDAAAAARDTAKAQLQAAKSEFENAEREAKRLTELFEQRVAPEKEYRDALTRRDMFSAMVARGTGQVAEKSADAERLDTMLAKAKTHSPLEGVISKRYVEVGQWIEKGAAVADLLQLDPLFVEVNVPEEVIARVAKGDPAQIRIDALGQQSFEGKVDQILPQADPGSRTFRVKILLPNPEFKIWPGFFARATLTSKSEAPQFVVPRDALVTKDAQSHVVVARDVKTGPAQGPMGPSTTGTAVVVQVTVGRSDSRTVSIVGDLKQGDLAVTRGNDTVRGGETLIIMNPPAPASQPTAAAARE
jgi:membrane fusion protein (multidrug efflux system)